jgi:hypothetical protein
VRVQAGQRGILAVAVKGRPGLPFDEDQHLPGVMSPPVVCYVQTLGGRGGKVVALLKVRGGC